MKNLKEYDGDIIEFFDNVLKSKKNSKKYPGYKTQLENLKEIIHKQLHYYLEKFDNDILEELVPLSLNETDDNALQKMYSYSQKIFQNLKVKLTTNENNRKSGTCQYCTIGEVNSFDHFTPQSEFPEFVVNPINLIPCCTTCNGYKGNRWRKDGKRTLLNLYLDLLPQTQYLFVDIVFEDSVIIPNFYLDNQSAINEDLFRKIENHYNDLMLFKRFRENSDNVISELENTLRFYGKKISIEDIKGITTEERSLWGYNYWQTVLKLELLDNDEFLKLNLTH